MKKTALRNITGVSLFVALAILISSWGTKEKTIINHVEMDFQHGAKEESIINDQYINDLINRKSGIDLSTKNRMTQEEIVGFEKILQEDPFIDDVKIYFDQSGILHFDIQAKKPIARVIDRRGKNYYVTFRGEMVPFSYSYSPRVVVITGFLPEVGREDWNKLMEVIRTLDANEFIRAQMESVFITKESKLVMIPKVGDFEIQFGDLEDSTKKFKKLQSFYEETYNKLDWSQYSDVVLDYEKQVILKKEKNRA